MDITEKLTAPLIETRYLSVENADRYRSIMRLFYLNYEKMRYWMYQEEVYEALKQSEYFSSYTPEQCQQDLKALTEWKNLMTIQDTRKVASIEEFKNKKFRYQLSEYSVEIERMVIRLENLFVEGASLEPTLLERLRIQLSKLEEISKKDQEAVYSWWNDLNHDFVRLNQNYQDYMRELNSVKAEEMMRTREFLLFKDRLIDYLRSFVKSLQMNVGKIEQSIRQAAPSSVHQIISQVTAYELSIPRIDVEVDEEGIRERMEGRWESIRSWFLGNPGTNSGSEAAKVFDTTNEIIRKITRYAARISESSNNGANRREEYHKLAVMFGRCTDMEQAHRLSALVFGIEKPVHLKGDIQRKTESMNSGVYEEDPLMITVTPRVRTYKEKGRRKGIVDRTAEKQAMKEAELRRIREERQLLKGYIQGGRLDFEALPVLDPHTRDVFLAWLSKAMEGKERRAKTEEGQHYHVEEKQPGERCVVTCTDGSFSMPAYSIVFEEDI
ncbi:MAG: TIGR02677 family protein [Lachnospiraceae bacterium]|nr:TIGR02677 family protein [Lachnospiraceae bacterium]